MWLIEDEMSAYVYYMQNRMMKRMFEGWGQATQVLSPPQARYTSEENLLMLETVMVVSSDGDDG